jgi:class 3 adenylate cyclase
VPVLTCPSCGQENPRGFRFCGRCGGALAPEAAEAREERKVVTVLFADLVGSTSRAEGLDPEDVRAILSPFYGRLRSELERFGGTVEKFIGDAVVAVFGAPVAREDDPERAVRAALAIRDWVLGEQELQVRIGVHTGEALVSLGARPAEGEGMVAGDVVNTTARLQSAAPVNGILVGEQTFRATERTIEYRDGVPVHAKGKTEPIPVWEAVQPRSRLGVDIARSHTVHLVGRGHELAVVREVLERALDGQTAQLLTLVGAPGIGKSRLVFELMRLVETNSLPEPIIWRQGRSLPYGEGVSYWAFAEIVKAQAGILDGDSLTETEAKLRRAAETVAGEEAEWVLRHLRVLVGTADEGAALSNQVERFAAWRRFVEGIAEQWPLVLVFEDLHWADEGLLEFVDHLVEWVSGLPLLVVGTARPELLERRPTWGGGKLNATTLALSPLSDDETTRLLETLLDRPLSQADDDPSLVERAGGNPLYAEQYARMLLERSPVAGTPVPDNLHAIIAGRLDALSSEEKRLLQNASVLGKVFWSATLVELGGGQRAQVEQSLHGLERRDFVQRARRTSVAGSEEYSFRHVLIRDVAYGQIPRATRSDKHRAAAAWLQSLGEDEHAELIAHHYVTALELARAAGAEDAKLEHHARHALVAAADRAWALNGFAQTVVYARRALELLAEDDEERPYLLLRLGRGRRFSDESGAEELEQAREGLLALGDLASAAEAAVLLADLAAQRGYGSAVERHAADAEALVAELPPSAPKALVLGALARFRMLGTAFAPAARLAGEVLELAEKLGLEAVKASALNTRGVARVHLGDRSGLRDVEESLGLALRIESVPDVLRGYANLTHVVGWLGDERRAHELSLEHLRVTERLGAGGLGRHLRGNLPYACLERGEWDEALRLADEFIAEVEAGAPHVMEHRCRAVRAEIRLARGDVEGAIADSELAVESARRSGGEPLHDALSRWARVMVEVGRLEEASAALDELLALADADHSSEELEGNLPATEAARRLGRAEEIRGRLEEKRSSANAWHEAILAYLRGDFRAAADRYRTIGTLDREARVRLAAAEALVAEGRDAEANIELERALAFFRSVGATRYVREAEALLAPTNSSASDDNPRLSRGSGWS